MRFGSTWKQSSSPAFKSSKSYLSHIAAHNNQGATCRAIISTPAQFQLIAIAAELDANSNIRGEPRV